MVPWLRHPAVGGVRLTPSQMETLGELGVLRANGAITEEDFLECMDGAVESAVRDVERCYPPRPKPTHPRHPPLREEMLLVTILTGGSGVCPVCRSPVTNILRLGPDTRTTDGRMVALVLPNDVYEWKAGE